MEQKDPVKNKFAFVGVAAPGWQGATPTNGKLFLTGS